MNNSIKIYLKGIYNRIWNKIGIKETPLDIRRINKKNMYRIFKKYRYY